MHIYIGHRIREIRQTLGLSIKQLSEKVGLSYLTMQKIETDKISPSVVTLAKIAECLVSPITVFLEKKKPIVFIKKDDQKMIDTKTVKLRILAPKGALDKNLAIWIGKTKKGTVVKPHRNEGFEFAYVIKGRTIFKYGNESYEMDDGDVIYYDATELHSHTALEPHEYLGIHFSQVSQNDTDEDKR
jgi:transcriptional regulator with XRE-family HTH domain